MGGVIATDNWRRESPSLHDEVPHFPPGQRQRFRYIIRPSGMDRHLIRPGRCLSCHGFEPPL